MNPNQIGVPTVSIHLNVMLLMLVITNSEARSHFKRKLAGWGIAGFGGGCGCTTVAT